MAMPTFHLAPDLPPVSRLCFGSSSDSPLFSPWWTVLNDSCLCLCVCVILAGTMTMGEQSGAACSLRLLDAAYDAGVNFFDSAEM